MRSTSAESSGCRVINRVAGGGGDGGGGRGGTQGEQGRQNEPHKKFSLIKCDEAAYLTYYGFE